MDIKSKNIRYSKGVKAIAIILVWISFVIGIESFIYTWDNWTSASESNKRSYYETNNFKYHFSTLVNLVSETYVNQADLKGKSQLSTIRDKNNSLVKMVNFVFYIRNTTDKSYVTNLKVNDPINLIKKQPSAHYYSTAMKRKDKSGLVTSVPYEIYAAVKEPLQPGDVFYNDYKDHNDAHKLNENINIALYSSLAILIIAIIYLTLAAGHTTDSNDIKLSYIDGLFADVYTVFVLIAAYLSLYLTAEFWSDMSGEGTNYLILAMILSVDSLIGIPYVLAIVRQIKARTLHKNTLIYKAIKSVKSLIGLCFNEKYFMGGSLILLVGYAFGNCILFGFLINESWYYLDLRNMLLAAVTIGFNIFCLSFAAKILSSLSIIMSSVNNMRKGKMENYINTSQISPVFVSFSEDINSIQEGLKKAVDSAVKGERLKTELITNVSHDLKTPLTSIINYVDLLKQEELNNEKADEYLEVLDEKSSRLKQLIEDLVEASKASSGNVAVNEERINLFELVDQARGEYEEKLNNSNLELIVKAVDADIFVSADGKHMWRIIENLLSNVCKYAMNGTRVYIDVTKNDLYGILTVKNMAAYQLDISPEQLTERFVRGDKARTTEGSGLGLSIAQNLTTLQQGIFKIDIDGDLFKVIVNIPLWTEE